VPAQPEFPFLVHEVSCFEHLVGTALALPDKASRVEAIVIEHVSLRCKSVKKSRAFYERALAPLGYRATQVYPGAVGFKADGHTSFWVTQGKVATPTHIAFRARGRRAVRGFHQAALEAGAKDNGAPGLRAGYGRNYYAAFVLDPVGHNMEAVSFAMGRRAKQQRPGWPLGGSNTTELGRRAHRGASGR
jgi:catechol 2,3-dioxygenase-like lactoylglutathione lyase family enzyme